MFVTSNVYLNIMFLHIACGFELLHNPFKLLVLRDQQHTIGFFLLRTGTALFVIHLHGYLTCIVVIFMENAPASSLESAYLGLARIMLRL